MTTARTIWISWENHRRTTGICEALGIPLTVLTFDGPRVLRYPILALRTLAALARSRPDVLIVQNPSLVLTFLALLLRPLFRYGLIVDAHNEAIEPYIHDTPLIRSLSRRLVRGADATIVTNTGLAARVEAFGGSPIVLPDRIPTRPHAETTTYTDGCHLALISTFEADEPFGEVFDAVAGFSDSITLHVTGRYTKLPESYRASLSSNIDFTGFLSEHDYWQLLNSVDAVIDLSLMDNCLVCGAYEGVAAGKPLLLSDNEAVRGYFRTGTLYVGNDKSAITAALQTFFQERDRLTAEASAREQAMREEWIAIAAALESRIESFAS